MNLKIKELIFWIIAGIMLLLSVLFSGTSNNAVDFAPIYYSSELITQNQSIYDFAQLKELIINNGHDPSAVHYLYPPFLASIIQPLTKLGINNAMVFWLIINCIAIILSLALLFRRYIKKNIYYYLLAFLILCFYMPVLLNLQIRQINPIILFLLCLGLIMMLNKKEWLAGISLGLASLIKVFPVVFLFYALVLKKWKIFFSGLITILAGSGLAILLIGSGGLSMHWQYISNIIPSIFSGNLPGWSPGTMLPGSLDLLWITPQYSEIIKITSKILLIIFFGFIIYKYWFKKKNIENRSISIEYSFLAGLLVILSAYSFHHYLIWLIIPFVVIYSLYQKNADKKIGWWLLIAFILGAFPPIAVYLLMPVYVNDYIFPLINPGFFSIIITIWILIWQYLKIIKKSSHDFHT